MDSAEHLWDEQCILKAQEVLTDLSFLKRQLLADTNRRLEDIKREFQALKDQNIHNYRKYMASQASEKEIQMHNQINQ